MGINRNIVECKVCDSRQSNVCRVTVLIETLWNVKTQDVERRKSLSVVLIETLWNVKRSEFLAVLGDQKY